MRHRISFGLIILCLVLSCVMAACGAGASPTAPLPTPTLFPTYNFVQPTEAPVVVTVGAETMTAGSTQLLDPEKVSLGKARYEALDCGSCHGADAKGTDKGKALVPNKLTEDQFIDFLRTGGNVGSTHLYSTNRLSDAGGKNLYVYILSLSSGS